MGEAAPIIGRSIAFSTNKTKRFNEPSNQSIDGSIRCWHWKFFQFQIEHKGLQLAMVFEGYATIPFQKGKIMLEHDDRHPSCR